MAQLILAAAEAAVKTVADLVDLVLVETVELEVLVTVNQLLLEELAAAVEVTKMVLEETVLAV
jgi:hypothetical protein